MKGNSSEEEEIKIPKCSRKSHIETVNKEMKEISSEEENIGLRKCSERRRVDIINKELRGWISLLKSKNLLQK